MVYVDSFAAHAQTSELGRLELASAREELQELLLLVLVHFLLEELGQTIYYFLLLLVLQSLARGQAHWLSE